MMNLRLPQADAVRDWKAEQGDLARVFDDKGDRPMNRTNERKGETDNLATCLEADDSREQELTHYWIGLLAGVKTYAEAEVRENEGSRKSQSVFEDE